MLEAEMNRSVWVGIVAGAALAVSGGAGVAVAAIGESLPRQAAVGQQTASNWSMSGPISRMPAVNAGDEADYLTHMVAHHQEAVEAARQLQRSGRAEMRTLGASIVRTQTAEIVTMKAWLATWYPGRPPASDYRPMMRDLSKLSGDGLDEAFLQDMIPHHMMAVMMSEHLLMHGSVPHAEVAAFADQVGDAQHAEMLQMRQYLADWFGGSGMSCPMWGRPSG
ncbi:DUF305 domain-containing protein [Nonomuraea sp. NBC_00507]|uniref:DUF305 domain-containing protein n=1 Tax=Nonomuraea sp. NBC_00507 TaxID=2976002 RepID=UPI002E18D4BE